ncbi:PTS lactose/cellobiose transporter subunit IIA [Kroppenstedtia pulmonis]|uniref:PTS lactose/cellobiose transporter subunit IIA n=2 Tax=Kroppenstedtia pulmonis TaxID=1380685 RepID=A0A7D3XZR7_9BACL|nr:PTS lactose/cellobiose transporter subunit IIA [Kroppenstedtia pulmonis]
MEEQMPIAFQLILHGGNARSAALEAIAFARKGDAEAAEASLHQAEQEISTAHCIHTDLIQKEAGGEETKVNLILVHAQDHLMNAITIKELAAEFVHLYREINNK